MTPQVETKREGGGGRGVEFGWNSRDGGRGPFVVMATAGFHPLIDPPRSRSSTKPQTLSLFLSDTRTHGDIYTRTIYCLFLSRYRHEGHTPSRRDSPRLRLIA